MYCLVGKYLTDYVHITQEIASAMCRVVCWSGMGHADNQSSGRIVYWKAALWMKSQMLSRLVL